MSSSFNTLSCEDVDLVIERSFPGERLEVIHFVEESYGKIGFMGHHGRLTVTLSDDRVAEFFLKSMPHGNDTQLAYLRELGVFKSEVLFYDKIWPVLNSSACVGFGDLVPRVYLARDDLMVMEDLKLKGYQPGKAPMKLDQVKLSISALAKFHALAILAEAKLGKTFMDLYPKLFGEKLFTLDRSNSVFVPGIKAMVKIGEKLGLTTGSLEKLSLIMRRMKRYLKPSRVYRNALCHGDTWSFNFMLKQNGCILVDFQLMRYAPPILDVLQTLYVNVDREFRQKWERQLLEYYQLELEMAMGKKAKDVCSLEVTLRAYEDLRLFGVISAALYLPVALMDECKLEAKVENEEGFTDFQFGDGREELILKEMDENEGYAKIMGDIVEELMEVGNVMKK